MSMANDAVWLPETAQTSPTITTTEVVAKEAASGGSGGSQGGPIDEACRLLRRCRARCRSKPPLAPRSCSEGQGSLRSGLPAPTGRPDGRRMAGWAEGDAEDAATDGASWPPLHLLLKARAHVVVYTVVL